MMALADDIIAERIYGVVHCGFSSKQSPSLPELAREFGLSDDSINYREIDAVAAKRLVQMILHQDMAYNLEVMSSIRAIELADMFFARFGSDGVRFFTNGNFHEMLGSGGSWNSVTAATFDTGVLVIGPRISGCLWIEDED